MRSLAAVLVLNIVSTSAFAGDAPKPAETTAADSKSAEARIAELEGRVASLEEQVQNLKKIAEALRSRPENASRSSRPPNDEERKRYEALSDAGKEKLRDVFKNSREELSKLSSDDARRDFIKKAFDRIEAEDNAAGSK